MGIWLRALGFGIWLRVLGFGLGLGFRIPGFWFSVLGLGFRDWPRVWGPRVWGLGFWDFGEGLAFRVSEFCLGFGV